LQDIINHFRDNGVEVGVIKKNGDKSNMDRSHFSRILESPLYVRADKDVYQYLVSKGYEILDDVEAFDGVHGLFRHKKYYSKDSPEKKAKFNAIHDKEYIKVGYHEGIVDSETWLAVQDKKSRNQKIPNNNSAKNSWLVGLTKCPHCNNGFYIYYGWNVSRTKQWRYYGDRGAYTSNGCVKKRLRLRPDDVEKAVFNAMKEKLESIELARKEKIKPNKETDMLETERIRINDEIRKLMDKYADADETLSIYIKERVHQLHAKKSDIEERLRAKTRSQKAIDTSPLTDPMNRWDSLTVDEKHAIASIMVEVVYISDDEGIDIRFCI
jgi:DNA-binding transcriptional MerR regulator